MSTRNRSGRKQALLSAAVLAGIGVVQVNRAAATDVWTGTDSAAATNINWSDPGNWGGTTVSSGDLLNFSGANTTNNNNFSGYSCAGITFNSGAGAFNLSGNAITLGPLSQTPAYSLTGGVVNNSASLETFGLGVTLAPGNTPVSATSGQLSFGSLTRQTDATAQFNNAGGVIHVGSGLTTDLVNGGTVIGNDSSGGGGIVGGWATINSSSAGNGSGGWATINGSGNLVLFTGYNTNTGSFTTAIGGNEQVTGSNGTATITPSAGDNFADMNTLIWSPSSNGGNENVSAGSAFIRLGVDGGIMSVDGANRTFNVGSGSASGLTAGGPTNGSSGEITLSSPFTTISGRSIINAVVQNNVGGIVTVNVASGYWDMKQVNTYTGGTYIANGEMLADAGASKTNPLGTGPIYVYPGGRVDFGSDNTGTINNNIYIAGYGFNNGSSPGAIKGTFNGTFNGTITLMSSASIDPNAGGLPNTCTFNGPITGTGSLTIGGSTTSLVAGNATFGGVNNYTGDLIIDASANENGGAGVKIGSGKNNIIQNGGNLSLIGGTSGTALFDIGGTQQSINGLSSASTASGNLTRDIVASNVTGGVLTLGGNNVTATFGGVIEGGYSGTNPSYLSLIKTGTGTETLAGANLYTGSTTINSGMLSVTGSLAGTAVNINGGTLSGKGTIGGLVTLNSGGIDPGATGPGSVGTLTLSGGLTFNAGNMGFDLGANGSNSDHVVVTGAGVNFAAASSSAYTITPIGGVSGQSYTLISGTSMTGSNIPTLVQPTSRLSYMLDPAFSYNGANASTSLIIDVSGQTANLTWNNATGGDGVTWDVAGNQNWNSSATVLNPYEYYQADNVTFNDNNNGNYNVSLGVSVAPGSVTVNTNGAYNISGSGSIIGPGGLSMSSNNGTGSLTLSTANTFSGGTTLNSGTLNLGNAAALGTGSLTINGGTIDNTSGAPVTLSSLPSQTWTNSFTFIGTQNLNMGGGIVTLSNTNTSNTTVTVANSNAVLAVTGNINGSGQALTKAGNGTLMLGGNNTFSGGVTINAGILQVASVGGGASSLGTGVTTVNAGGTLVGAGSDSFGYGSNTNNSAGIVIVGGTVTDLGSASYRITMPNLTFTGGTLTSAAGNSGDANGNYSLFGNGSGACTITTNATSTTATISAAKISLQEPATFDIGAGNASSGVDLLISSTIVPNGTQPLIMAGPGVLKFSAANTYTGTTNIAGGTLTVPILAAGGTASGIGASSNAATNLILNGGTLQYTGPAVTTDRLFTLGTGGGALDASGTGALNFNNTGAATVSFSGNRTLTLTGTNTGINTLAASIGDSALSGTTNLVKNGTGTWVLTGSNSFSGGATINSGALSVTGSLSGSGAVNILGGKLWGNGSVSGPVTLNGGTIDPGATGPGSIGTLNMSGGLTISTGTDNLNFDIGSVSNDQINAGSATVAFNSPSSLTPTGGANGSSYTLVTSGSMTGTFIPTLIEPTTSRLTYAYDPASYNGSNGATSLIIDANGQTANLTWNNTAGTGGDGVTWDVAGNQNWNSSATVLNPYEFYQADNVTFNDNNNGNYNVSLGVSVSPSSVTVSTNGAYNISGSGSIIGSGGLSVSSNSGSGSLTLSTSNTFSGGTILNSGILNANRSGALGTGTVTVNGGTLNINNAAALNTSLLTINGGTLDNTSAAPIILSTVTPQSWTGSFTFTGTQNLNMGSGIVTLNNTNTSNTTVTVANSNAVLGISAVINGSGQALTKAGSGTLLLTGNNNFNGGVTVSAGTLEVTSGGGGASGLGSANTSVVVSANGTLIGGGADAFGYNASNPGLMTIYINGGTVTDLPGAYRVTLPNISFTGGMLTSNASNTGLGTSGQFSLYAGTVQSNPASSTAIINAATISLQDLNTVPPTLAITTFNVAAGSVTGGSYPGVDLYVSSTLENFSTEFCGVVMSGTGKMELAGSNTYNGSTNIIGGVLTVPILVSGGVASGIGASNNAAGSLILNGGTLQYIGAAQTTNRLFTLGAGGGTLDASGIGALNFNNSGSIAVPFNGNRTLTLTGTSTATNTLAVAIGDSTLSGSTSILKSGAGTWVLSGSNTYSGGTNVATGTLIFNGSSALPAFSGLTVGAAIAQVANHGANPVSVLQAGTLVNNGLIDLTNNGMVIRSGSSLGSITSQAAQGYSYGTWQGNAGITSSTAAADTTHLTAVGVIVNDNGSSTPLYGAGGAIATSFDGSATVDDDILVKYTYYGDANLDGQVDGTDYSRIDNGYLNNLSGWYNGDFNYDGVINGSDYTLIDNACNTQGPSLATEVASPTAQVAGSASVPEPAISSLLGMTAVGLLGRRRRRC